MHDLMPYIVFMFAAMLAVVLGKSLYAWQMRRNKHRFSDAEFLAEFEERLVPTALRVRQVLRRSLGKATDTVAPDDDLFEESALGNSFDLAFEGFIMDLEKEFRLSIPDETAAKLNTLRRLAEHLHSIS